MAGSQAKISFHGAVLDTRVLDKITEELKPRAFLIVNKYGNAMTSTSAQNAPVDTGALRSSLTSESMMTGELTYTISDGVEYGVYQEFGTSRIPARPFMLPAIEAWTDRFLNAFKDLFK